MQHRIRACKLKYWTRLDMNSEIFGHITDSMPTFGDVSKSHRRALLGATTNRLYAVELC